MHCLKDVKMCPCNIWLYVVFSWWLALLHLAHERILFVATRIERPLALGRVGLGSGKQGGTMWIGIDSIVSLQRPNIPFHIPEWASIGPQKGSIYTRKIWQVISETYILVNCNPCHVTGQSNWAVDNLMTIDWFICTGRKFDIYNHYHHHRHCYQ